MACNNIDFIAFDFTFQNDRWLVVNDARAKLFGHLLSIRNI